MYSDSRKILNDDNFAPSFSQNWTLRGEVPNDVQIIIVVAEIGVFKGLTIVLCIVLLDNMHENHFRGVTLQECSDRIDDSLKVSVKVDQPLMH